MAHADASLGTSVLIEVLPIEQTVVVVPLQNSRAIANELMSSDPAGLFKLLDRSRGCHVVVDCGNIPVGCSAMLAFFVRLWKWTRAHERRFAFCNVSAELSQEFEILNLNGKWPVYRSRPDAVEHVKGR